MSDEIGKSTDEKNKSNKERTKYSKEFDDRLIALAKKENHLYNKSNKLHYDFEVTDSTYKAIADTLDVTGI